MENIIKVNAKCSSNNTILQTVLPNKKDIILTTGALGFKGAKRSTPHAAQQMTEYFSEKLIENKTINIILIFKGFGKGRKSIIKGFNKKRIKIFKIIDKTPEPHTGCRAPKKRRL
jgi:small subunit ribosomal protein S11